MSSNPPILSIPPQLSSPASHIRHYLSSIRPHAAEHARAGITHFQRALEAGSSKTLSSKGSEGKEPIMFGKRRDSNDQDSDWVTTRQEIMERRNNTRKDINKAPVLISNDRSQLKTIQSNIFKMPLAAVKEINDFPSKERPQQSTKENGDETKDAETESAQREYPLQIQRAARSS